ncbi:DsrE family protein [archaeon]|nr:DsrE family protein [archaeon]
MKLGIVLNSNDAETAWNCVRLAIEALQSGHAVRVFLLGKGVEFEAIRDERFSLLQGAAKKFTKNGGVLLACGTCLQLRQKQNAICPISTMSELLQLIEESDKIISLG